MSDLTDDHVRTILKQHRDGGPISRLYATGEIEADTVPAHPRGRPSDFPTTDPSTWTFPAAASSAAFTSANTAAEQAAQKLAQG
ncbi:hypothetical protein, partial [Streptomyces chryseus]|uniref:hypothetical protein n=1 Tax=Streptomyces chryseus TaxID=68186 RepID=UPI001476F07E